MNNSVLKGNVLFEKYIRKNFLKYVLVLVIYLIGFLIGISIFSNKLDNKNEASEISQYLTESIESLSIQTTDVIGNYVKQDFLELIIICILSFSIIGIPVIMILLFTKAISLGITISALIYSSGAGAGLSFSILVFLVPVLIKMAVLLMLVCSSFKFLENILKYKKEIKYEIIRHAFVNLISLLATLVLIVYSSFSINVVNQILF